MNAPIVATLRSPATWRPTMRRLSAVVLAAPLCAMLALAAPALPQGETGSGQLPGGGGRGLAAIDAGVRNVVTNIGPSIVTVIAAHRIKGKDGKYVERSYTTSGIVMDPHGHIVATADPITETCRLFVVTESPAGKSVQYTAVLVGRSHAENVAVIRLLAPPKWLWPIRSGSSDRLGPGSIVFALTRHYKLPVSCSLGFVTGSGRRVKTKQRTLNGLMVTSGIAGQGDVGGAIVSVDGRAVAMLMSTYDSLAELREMTAEDESSRGGRFGSGEEVAAVSTVKFSMPIERVLTVANKLIVQNKNREVPVTNEIWRFLGVRGEYLRERNALSAQLGLKRGYGFLVNELFEGEAAARGGIREYDIILQLGGTDIHYKKFPLGRAIKRAPLGHPVSVLLLRGGRRIRTSVTFGPAKHGKSNAATPRDAKRKKKS